MTQDNPLVVEALSGSVAVEYQPPVSFGNACIGDLQQLTRCMSFMKSPEWITKRIWMLMKKHCLHKASSKKAEAFPMLFIFLSVHVLIE